MSDSPEERVNFQQLKIIREAARQDYNLTEVANMLYTSQFLMSVLNWCRERRRKLKRCCITAARILVSPASV